MPSGLCSACQSRRSHREALGCRLKVSYTCGASGSGTGRGAAARRWGPRRRGRLAPRPSARVGRRRVRRGSCEEPRAVAQVWTRSHSSGCPMWRYLPSSVDAPGLRAPPPRLRGSALSEVVSYATEVDLKLLGQLRSSATGRESGQSHETAAICPIPSGSFAGARSARDGAVCATRGTLSTAGGRARHF